MKPVYRMECAHPPFRAILSLAALALLGTFLIMPPASADLLDTSECRSVRVGLTNRSFPNVDQREALAAMQLWSRELARGMGIKSETKTIIYSRNEDLVAAVNKGELTIVSLPALDYLKIRRKVHMSPALVSIGASGYKSRYLLVTRRDSGIRTFHDLRGKSLVMASSNVQSPASLWLSVFLLKEGNRDQTRFFREVKESLSPSKALMNVFFRKSDVALLSRGAFETSIALNPQLGNQMAIMSESGNLVGVITCITDNVSSNLRRSIENAAMHLHENSIGKQMCTLFQMDRVVPFQASYLSGLEELLRERDRLLAMRARKR